MKARELRKIRRQIDEAGNPQDRKRALQSAVSVLEHEIQRLEDEKAGRRQVFHRKLEAWWSTPIKADQVPFAIPEDRRAGLRYKIAAGACVIFDALLGVWICLTLDLPWWIGILIAVLVAIVFDGAFSLAFWHVDRPKETLGELKRRLLWPSMAVFGVSFALLLLARTLSGEWAVFLLPVFGVSLWTITLGALLFGGTLFAAVHVIEWSYRDSQEYTATTREQTDAKLLRDECLNKLNELTQHLAATLAQQQPVAPASLTVHDVPSPLHDGEGANLHNPRPSV